MSLSNEKIYLLGGDVSRSKSFLIHNSIYKFLNLNFEYELVSLSSKDKLLNFLDEYVNNHFFACNVTFPYKTIAKNYVLEHGDYVSDTALWADGCNLVVSPKLSAYNYDGFGCCKFLDLKGILLQDKIITICGTGATAKSIACAMLKSGAKKINFLSRSNERILELKSNWEYFNNKNIEFYTYADSAAVLHSTDILIDACPKAKYKDVWQTKLIDLANLKTDAVVIDVLYKDSNMAIERMAKESSHMFFDGKGMLISQAVLCIQEICKHINHNNKNANNFEKMYNVGLEAIS